MDRGTRRHHTARIRIRKNRRLWEEHGRWLWEPGARSKLWWPMHKLTMSSYPKWWDVEYHTRPARIRSNGRWSSAGALRRRFAAVRFCLASPDMPLRPRWRGKSLVRTRCRVKFPGAAPNCPVSIAGDAAVLYTDDTAFDSPTGLQFCRESIDGDAPDSYPG